MKRRILLVLLASLTAVAILSGCSGKTTEQTPSSQAVSITNTSEEVVVSEEKEKFSLQDYIPETEKGYFQEVVYLNEEYKYTEREDFVKEYGDPYKYLHPHVMVNGYLIEIVSRAEQDNHTPVLDFYLGGYEFLAGATGADLVDKLTEYCNGNAIDCTGKYFEEAENEALSKMEKTFIYSYDDYDSQKHSEDIAQRYPKGIRVAIIEPRAPKSTKSEIMLDTLNRRASQ